MQSGRDAKNGSSTFEDYVVEQIQSKVGKEFIRKHHYSHSCHNGPMCWGLVHKSRGLVGVIAFATPCSENVRASVYGPDRKNEVTELHRMVILDAEPWGMATWFMSRAIKGLKGYRPAITAVLSFADSTEGHEGTVYRAANFHEVGSTGSATFYRDAEGRLRHPRQNGVNISTQEAKSRGWRPEKRGAKKRFILFVGTPRQKKSLLKQSRFADY